MLTDRKALIEQELKKAQNEAANMYLSIVVSGGDTGSKDYENLKDKISSLKFDLNAVNLLISQGHK